MASRFGLRLALLASIIVTSYSFAGSQASPLSLANTMPCYEPFFSFAASPGAIGTTCKGSYIGDTERILAYYQNYTFDFESYLRSIDPTSHNRLYADSVLDLLEQIAEDFYRERAALEQRTFTIDELEGWKNAVLAVAYQESLMTHFQFDLRPEADAEKIQVLVGDAKCKVKWEVKDGKYYCPEYEVNSDGKKLYGSIGMYQIMLSVHASSSKLGFFDVVHNIQYGMSFSYSTWIKIIRKTHAGLAKCEDQIFDPQNNKSINYVNAARSMYSVYNGGPAKVCRWTEDTIWKQNDNGYKYAIENHPWQKFSSSQKDRKKRKTKVLQADGSYVWSYVFPFDLKCIREGRDLCLKTKRHNKSTPIAGVLFSDIKSLTSEERFCTWSDVQGRFVCVGDEKAAACLQLSQPTWRTEYESNRFSIEKIKIKNAIDLEGDGETLCPLLTGRIHPVGEEIWIPVAEAIYVWPESLSVLKDIFYYSVPARILAFEVRPGRNEIWYRLEYYKNGIRQEGWVSFL